MGLFRCTSALLAAVVVVATAWTQPARAGAGPTTLLIEGTVRAVVIDSFGYATGAEHVYSVETDDGAHVPVDLQDAPADGRFRGELVVEGPVAAALDDKGLLPRAGGAIAEDSRAGRAAVEVAEGVGEPLTVAAADVAAAVTTTAAGDHRVYVALLDNRGTGTLPSTSSAAQAVGTSLDYWEEQAAGGVGQMLLGAAVVSYRSTVSETSGADCGTASVKGRGALWAEAAREFPGVDFAATGNHLVVGVRPSCGMLGIATVGSSVTSGGRVIMTFGTGEAFVGTHELGHNLGLDHANLDACPLVNPISCEYYDVYSPMGFAIGNSPPPALGSLYRSELGVEQPGEIVPVALAGGATSSTQTFTLQPRGALSGQRGLLVTDPATGVVYSVDLRTRTGRDTGAFYGSGSGLQPQGFTPPSYPSGVVIERQRRDITPLGTSLLETYLVTHAGVGALRTGAAFVPSGSLTITVVELASTAVVKVDLGTGTPAVVPVTTPSTSPAGPSASPSVPQGTLSGATPRITGTPKVGRTLKVKVGSWSPKPRFTYQWFANGKKITAKGTKASFTLTSTQKGKRITVKVTASRTGYTTVTKTSKKTKRVAKK